MRAVVFYGKEDVRIEEVPEPTPGPGQVKVRTAHVGICGTDLHVYYEPDHSGSDFSQPHPLTGAMPPQILGHEFSGTVVEVGPGVTDLAVGDRVACYPVYWCGECAPCRDGRHACCPKAGFHGLNSHGGGLATFTILRAEQCMTLPDSVDLRMGALVEPLAASWRAIKRSGATPGDRVLVIGAGPMGLGAVIALKARGVDSILVSEPSQERRTAAEKVGASQVIDPAVTALSEAVDMFTGGAGLDVVVDAAGVAAPLLAAMDLMAAGGTAVIIGVHVTPIEIDPLAMLLRETALTTIKAYDKTDYAEVIAAMAAGLVDPSGWVSDVPLDRTVETIADLRSGRGVKVLVTVA